VIPSRPGRERAVFLDRDGVLIEDVDLLDTPERIRILPGVPRSLQRLADNGFKLIVVSNQAIVARGVLTEKEMLNLHAEIEQRLQEAGSPPLSGFYYCPHHPSASISKWRIRCECRKPRPGLLQKAASEICVDLKLSFMVGDRLTDALAGARAGCRSVLVETGMHEAPLIESPDLIDPSFRPDFICPDLGSAVDWILQQP
jgi:D-glycero-D-manno-heptose 1,7-bisphosphate phosphatase